MQRWKKLGRIFHVSGEMPWMMTHAAVPTAFALPSGAVRVYFGTRNSGNQASVGFFDFSPDNPTKILGRSELPCLTPGALGMFDDSGVLPSWVLQKGKDIWLYYIGWNLGVTVQFRNFTGLARSTDGGKTFERVSRAPIADRDDTDPHFFTNPCVLAENGNHSIWYLSGVRWEAQANGSAQHFYHIKQDTSVDGIRWDRKVSVAIDFEHPGECAISRPCVLREGGHYSMWYSYRRGPRGETYRIGYAQSADGKIWQRQDSVVGLDVSKDGWDSQSVEYAYVFDHGGKRYMIYNGNGFGQSGIGLAVLE
jgi:predicted GH43/DUF377 family glycosyl hydrolase